ncbi:MAG: HlyD family efflux transporter periplasmic adaptor subunit [Niameybacter sp.]|uniref:HlyD family efflux transporter periplasmic adaptor subunit n=1 Tax=Niameybacter sp. TaxID=2033640 RepID=UPI002FC902FA
MHIDIKKQLQKEIPPPKEKSDYVKQMALKGLAGFLIIMVVLTGLSRTADTLTTPQVTVTHPKGGRIEQKLEVIGSLKPRQEESMEAGTGLIVQDILVEAGDRVKKGDTLLILNAKALEEKLNVAQDELKKLQLRLEQQGLNKDFSTTQTSVEEAQQDIAKLEADKLDLIEKEQVKVDRVEKKVSEAQSDLQQTQADLEIFKGSSLKEQLQKAKEEETKEKQNLSDQKYEQEKALKRAEQALKDAKENLWLVAGQGTESTSALQAVERAEMEYDMTKKDWERKVKEAEETLKKASGKVKKLENGEIDESLLKQEEEKVKVATRQVEEQKRAIEDTLVSQKEALREMDRKIDEAKKALDVAVRKDEFNILKEEQTAQKESIDKQLMQLDIEAKQKEIEHIQKSIAEGGQMLAPADGMIKEVKVEKGVTTTGGDLVTFIGDTSEYILEVEVNQEESEGLQIGDSVEVTLEGEKQPLQDTVIENIVYVQGESSGKKKISVIVPRGDTGMNATLKVSKESEKYQYVLPIEAVKEDNNGSYVFVAKKKTTTLGEQMVAERVDVMKLDKNQSSVAVQGAFGPQDTLIVNSNKPISSGNRVRLIEQ